MKTIGKLHVAPLADREIVITRVFDAPRDAVFKAYTEPESIKRWLGPHDWPVVLAVNERKPGGAYRFVMQSVGGGPEMAFGGVYREFVPGERFVATERFDQPWYPGEALITAVFTEQEGRTALLLIERHESRDARDGVLASPMAEGVAESYDRLEALLSASASMPSRPVIAAPAPAATGDRKCN
ncbi:MAG TPA: SRPBCC family protein [Opitutaceae bacterium]